MCGKILVLKLQLKILWPVESIDQFYIKHGGEYSREEEI